MLKVTGINKNDKGLYGIQLSNPQGEVSANFLVTVSGKV